MAMLRIESHQTWQKKHHPPLPTPLLGLYLTPPTNPQRGGSISQDGGGREEVDGWGKGGESGFLSLKKLSVFVLVAPCAVLNIELVPSAGKCPEPNYETDLSSFPSACFSHVHAASFVETAYFPKNVSRSLLEHPRKGWLCKKNYFNVTLTREWNCKHRQAILAYKLELRIFSLTTFVRKLQLGKLRLRQPY